MVTITIRKNYILWFALTFWLSYSVRINAGADPETKAAASPVPQTAKTIAAFVPKHWILESSADGDLNKDNLADCALVVSDTEGCSDSKPAGQRKLVIALKETDGLFHKCAESDLAVPLSGAPPQLTIKKDVLIVEHSQGAHPRLTTNHKYQLHDDQWNLIGYTRSENDGAASHAVDSVDVNLLTGEVAGSLNAKRNCSARFLEIRSPQIEGPDPSPADWTAPSVWLNSKTEQCPIIAVQSVHSKDTLFLRTQLQRSNAIADGDVQLIDEKGAVLPPVGKKKTAYAYILSSYDLKTLRGDNKPTSDDPELLRVTVQVSPIHCGCKKTFATSQSAAGAILLTKMKGLPALAEVDTRDGAMIHPELWPLAQEK